MTALGAIVKQFPVAPFNDPNNYNQQAKTFAESIENAHWTNQFDNTQNRQAHIETTGPEIWRQTNGKVDAVVFGTGTGGTLAGTSTYLKGKNKDVKAFCADPPGAVLYNFYKHGKLERKGDGSITEGIGQGRITDNMKDAQIDDALYIPDFDSVNMTFRLLHEEGYFLRIFLKFFKYLNWDLTFSEFFLLGFFVGATSGLNGKI